MGQLATFFSLLYIFYVFKTYSVYRKKSDQVAQNPENPRISVVFYGPLLILKVG